MDTFLYFKDPRFIKGGGGNILSSRFSDYCLVTVNSNCQTSCKAMKLFFSSAVDSKIFIVKWWSTFVLLQALKNRPNWWNANKMLGIIKVYGWGEKRSTRVENSALTNTADTALITNQSTIDRSINQSIRVLYWPYKISIQWPRSTFARNTTTEISTSRIHPPTCYAGEGLMNKTNGVCLANVKLLDFPTGVHCIWSKLLRFNSVILVLSWVLLLHSFFYLKKYWGKKSKIRGC